VNSVTALWVSTTSVGSSPSICICYALFMISKEVKLSSKALKLLSEYSEAKGITPSQALEQLVPKTKKQTVKAFLKKASRLSEK
jgi:hypothetical protein